MKNIKSILKGLMIIGVIAIGALTGGQKANADTVYTESNDNYYIEQGDAIIEHNDGSYDIKYADGIVDQYDKDSNFIFNIIDSYKTEDNGQLTEYSDGSFAYVNVEKGIYSFTAYEMGDWDYSFDNIDNLNNCIKSYASYINYDRADTIYIVNSYMKENGNLVIEYNDDSYAVMNNVNNYFEFIPSITEDYGMMFNNANDFINCVSTYKSIKETGMY